MPVKFVEEVKELGKMAVEIVRASLNIVLYPLRICIKTEINFISEALETCPLEIPAQYVMNLILLPSNILFLMPGDLFANLLKFDCR